MRRAKAEDQWVAMETRIDCLVCCFALIRLLFLCSCSLPGAYLVPYFILLILIGIPLFFLELAVGQRIRRGSIGVWNYVYPQLGGIGVSSLMVRRQVFKVLQSIFHVGCADPSLSNKGREV